MRSIFLKYTVKNNSTMQIVNRPPKNNDEEGHAEN